MPFQVLPVLGVLSTSVWWHLQPSILCRVSQDRFFSSFAFVLGELWSVEASLPVWTVCRTVNICMSSNCGWRVCSLERQKGKTICFNGDCFLFSYQLVGLLSASIAQITCLISTSLPWRIYFCSQEEYNKVTLFRSSGKWFV